LLSKMQEENRIAKQQKRGLYQFTTTF